MPGLRVVASVKGEGGEGSGDRCRRRRGAGVSGAGSLGGGADGPYVVGGPKHSGSEPVIAASKHDCDVLVLVVLQL